MAEEAIAERSATAESAASKTDVQDDDDGQPQEEYVELDRYQQPTQDPQMVVEWGDQALAEQF